MNGINIKSCLLFIIFWSTSACSIAQNILSQQYFKRLNNWSGQMFLNSMCKGVPGLLLAGINYESVPDVTGCVQDEAEYCMLILADTDANIRWAHCYDGTGFFLNAGFSPNGEIWAVTGKPDTFFNIPKLNKLGQGVTVVKVDSSGSPLWYNEYGTFYANCEDFTATSDGGALILASYSNGGGDIPIVPKPNNGFGCWMCKLDSAGNIQWSKVLGGTGNQLPEKIKETSPGIYTALIQTTSTDYMLAGINFDSTFPAYWLLQTDAVGKILNSRIIEGPLKAFFSDFLLNENGSITLAGMTSVPDTLSCSSIYSNYTFLLAQADSSYQFEWCIGNGGSGSSGGGGLGYVCAVNDYSVVAGGNSVDLDQDFSSCSRAFQEHTHSWFGLYDLNKQLVVWGQALCGSGSDYLQGLTYDPAANALYVLISGSSEDGSFAGYALPNSQNIYLLKYNLIISGLNTLAANRLQLSVFPDPATDNITIKVNTQYAGELRVKLQDIAGAGFASYDISSNQFQLATEHLAAGMYLVEIIDLDGRSGAIKFVKQ